MCTVIKNLTYISKYSNQSLSVVLKYSVKFILSNNTENKLYITIQHVLFKLTFAYNYWLRELIIQFYIIPDKAILPTVVWKGFYSIKNPSLILSSVQWWVANQMRKEWTTYLFFHLLRNLSYYYSAINFIEKYNKIRYLHIELNL